MRPEFYIGPIRVEYIEGKGRGIVATEFITRGTVIEISPTIDINAAQHSVLSHTILGHYVFEHNDGIQAVMGLGYSSLYNHSDRPTALWQVGENMIMISLIRDVKPFQEITIDYGWEKNQLKGFRK